VLAFRQSQEVAMKMTRLIHQQVMQLRWHFLVCLGLVMVLPFEEGIVNLKDGAGFYAAQMGVVSLMMSPFLAGLIACANVQADFDDRRFIFWRSKPVGVKGFVALKYFAGLVMAALILLCPFLFTIISCKICEPSMGHSFVWPFVLNCGLILMMIYSLCFFCNVLIRKTARAWLVGVAAACFLMLVPFILPLNYKDVASDVIYVFTGAYSVLAAVVFVTAFVFSLVAVSRHWYLRTNLKGLLWAGAVLLFAVGMLFTRQVANIKILDETEGSRFFTGFIDLAGDKIVSQNFTDISVRDGKIQMIPMASSLSEELRNEIKKSHTYYDELVHREYPGACPFSAVINDTVYSFSADIYHREETVNDRKERTWEKLFVRVSKFQEGVYVRLKSFDISHLIDSENRPILSMRQIRDKLIVFVDRNCIVLTLNQGGEFELEDTVYSIKRYSPYVNVPVNDGIFKIPIVQINGLSDLEKIELSVDLNFRYGWMNYPKETIVDMDGETVIFCLVGDDATERYDCVRWDDKYVYCRYRDGRTYTLLEQMFGGIHDWHNHFVKDGKLYYYGNSKLMVYDVRSERIRKLGHFERLRDDFYINDIEVLDDGNILMSVNKGLRIEEDGQRWTVNGLMLLKNPE
jgi:hypothetical protein